MYGQVVRFNSIKYFDLHNKSSVGVKFCQESYRYPCSSLVHLEKSSIEKPASNVLNLRIRPLTFLRQIDSQNQDKSSCKNKK